MPNDLPKKYGISKARYRELKYFCLQYEEFKAQANDTYYISATAVTGMPSAHSNASNVESRAEKQQYAKDSVSLIERCVRLTCERSPGLYDALLKSVTETRPFEEMPVPCGRRQFYEQRQKFFCILNSQKSR